MRGEIKKKLVVILIIMFFITTISSVPAKQIEYKNINQKYLNYLIFEEPKSNNKKWTFMGYLDGDMSDIESSMILRINDMELIGSNSDVNIVIQADDCGTWNDQTRRYFIEHDDNPNIISSNLADNDTNEKNMGDPQTLIDFVCWAIDNYPAENYCLSIFNHGIGWIGICGDITNNGSYLNIPELKDALIAINNHLDRKLDILIFDACTMGMIEVFYPIKNYVNFSISSEIPTSDNDISYEGILENLTVNPLITPLEFSQKIVDTSYNTNPGKPNHVFIGINMNKMEEITKSFNELIVLLINNIPINYIIKDTFYYSVCWLGVQPANYPHDLRRFAEKISFYYDTNIKNKAFELINIIDNSVIKTQDNSGYINPRLNGVAIYFPPKAEFKDEYSQQEFANFTQWDEFLLKYYNSPRQDYQTIRPNFKHYFIEFLNNLREFINNKILLSNFFNKFISNTI